MNEIMNAKKAWEDAAWELHDVINTYSDGGWGYHIYDYMDEDILDYYDRACETGLVYTLLVG